MMDIQEATREFECWLREFGELIPADLARKHEQMARGAFPFLRSTYYRWAQVWETVCPKEAKAPKARSIGDLHVANFGTWRDIDGRLCWGINDFDEASALPYTNDLIRLGTSALLAIEESELAIDPEQTFEAITQGYAEALHAGGEPFVLADRHHWLRHLAEASFKKPEQFWEDLLGLHDLRSETPKNVRKLLDKILPSGASIVRIGHRAAGLGNLGKLRYFAVADWRGGYVTREIKALMPSASLWAQGAQDPRPITGEIIEKAVRSPDPHYQLRGGWIVRRLAPDCIRVDLDRFPKERIDIRLFRAMGHEVANVHIGSGKPVVKRIQKDLESRSKRWLLHASEEMKKSVSDDFERWKPTETH